MPAGLRRGDASQPLFLLDAGAPDAWPVAERIVAALPVLAEWVPVAFDPDPDPDWEGVARRAAGAGALPLRRPATWPPDTRAAMVALTYARTLGKTVAFALALLRHAYAAGRPLGDTETVLLAGAAAEVHPRALLATLGRPAPARDLAAVTAAARAAGADRSPAIVLPGGEVLSGPGCLEEAACALATSTA